MKQAGKSTTYQDHIRTRFIRYSLGIIVGMYGVFILFLVGNILLTTIGGTQRKAGQLSSFFEELFTGLDGGLQALAGEESLRLALAGEAGALHPANVLLYDFVNRQAVQANFALLDPQGNLLATNLYDGNQALLLQSDSLAQLQKALDAHPGETYYGMTSTSYEFGQAGVFTVARAVPGRQGGVAGYLLCDLRDEAVYLAMQAQNLDHVLLTDRFDNIVFSTSRPFLDPMEKYPTSRLRLDWQSRYTALLGGKEYYVGRQTAIGGQLQIYALSSIEFQKQLFLYGSVILLFLSAVAILVVRRLMNGFVRRNTEAIDKLVLAARQIGGGELAYRVESQTFDEFQALNDAFNILSQNLQEMMRHNEELAEHKRILELKQVESQFNPHFVFNTLETIRYKAILEPQVASDMVFRLATLMRYTMNFGNNMVPLRTDVRFLQDYLQLQKMRFGERLHYHIEVEEALLDRPFPKLLLQPVVENCFVHATQHTRAITVRITGRQREGTAELVVQDNGDGIPPARLSRLRGELRDEWSTTAGFGLYNVHRTVQLVYGAEYGLDIQSAPGQGATVTIRMPLIQEENDV